MPQSLLQGLGVPHVAGSLDHWNPGMPWLFLPSNDAAGKYNERLPDTVLYSHCIYGIEFLQRGQRIKDIKFMGSAGPLLRLCWNLGSELNQYIHHGARS